jgi:NADH dehydrogenase/NADH:ubiquinone oxidoreductase subunit G
MQIIIDNKPIKVDPKKSLLLNLEDNGINTPHVCYQEGLKAEARCRLCLIEINGKLVASCSTYPQEGMNVITKSKRVKRARRINAELLMSEHVKGCMIENLEHDLCKVIYDVGLREIRFEPTRKYKAELGAAVLRDNNLCVNCGRCVQVCADVQATWAIDFASRAHHEHVTPYFEKNLYDIYCTKCGQCIAACPVGAISESEHLP